MRQVKARENEHVKVIEVPIHYIKDSLLRLKMSSFWIFGLFRMKKVSLVKMNGLWTNSKLH
jgi:hypothetical protein